MLEIVKRALAALVEQRSAAHDELSAMAPAIEARGADAVATPEEEARAAELVDQIKDLDGKIAAHEARVAELAEIEARTAKVRESGLTFIRKPEPATPGDVRAMNATQLADVVKRGAEERGIDSSGAVGIIRRHRSDRDWLLNIAARSTDAYADAFAKFITGGAPFLTDAERAAIAVGTNTQGGLLVPTHLDPTLILTNTGSANALRRISRVVTLVREKTWNGVTTAGATASVDGELVEVSDDSPTFASAAIPTYGCQAFVQASYAAAEDIENLATDVLMILADARDRLEGSLHCTGTGSSQHTGIFTALDANTNVEVISTTAATIGLVDLLALKTAVGARWRDKGTWVMAPDYADDIRQLGSSLGASFSVDITQPNTERLLGRPVVETSDAPTTQTTTVNDNEIVYGDFSNFVIVDKPGSTAIEYIPALFNTSNNLPDGRRGWFMHWRGGSDSVNDVAFRLLQDKTSA